MCLAILALFGRNEPFPAPRFLAPARRGAQTAHDGRPDCETAMVGRVARLLEYGWIKLTHPCVRGAKVWARKCSVVWSLPSSILH